MNKFEEDISKEDVTVHIGVTWYRIPFTVIEDEATERGFIHRYAEFLKTKDSVHYLQKNMDMADMHLAIKEYDERIIQHFKTFIFPLLGPMTAYQLY